jgi:hypothetical protein
MKHAVSPAYGGGYKLSFVRRSKNSSKIAHRQVRAAYTERIFVKATAIPQGILAYSQGIAGSMGENPFVETDAGVDARYLKKGRQRAKRKQEKPKPYK